MHAPGRPLRSVSFPATQSCSPTMIFRFLRGVLERLVDDAVDEALGQPVAGGEVNDRRAVPGVLRGTIEQSP